ncbi:MAG: polyprenyl synthetase family protein [Lachnospiraceae bacterium]|uniref:Polyprenyl synthetase family protein n=1 Tax=Muricoprocola aceti TaxID=2981772 RepID=A0ABT2SQR7_9FIRM|nr:farnesyl diphosphate synthase [Muricoprocola aceti]MCI7226430.1 polyprenyl synthetase family protein [Lachnospiraceae bacterium]MCU6726393.1 polyprenyl synthetase family protein [Muricoprocola aceti]MDD7436497.1 polyprenyl synthetase family protein [Lachnospiraceae bacterium]MDY3341268.1 farnesyl diphosphate synthase [Lachnospiraceae bacterium]
MKRVIIVTFRDEWSKRTEEVQEILYRYLPEETGYQKTLLQAMNYSMQAGGKRLRPLLMQETYRLFGGTGRIVEPFMAAMEMIHTHSLIHDDLPAMDNDEYRRGRKTTHIVYGEAMAILAGDGLLNLAYETASRAFEMEPENPAVGKAMAVLARKTGITGMIGGQSVDVEQSGKDLSRGQLDFIYRLKTSALIEGSMMVGAILAGASADEAAQIEQVASDVGLAFQIRDDILDVTSTSQVLGKPINSDEKNHKTTYVTMEGLKKAEKDVKEISGRAIDVLDQLGRKNEFLRNLILELVIREK